jgi:hypothetical protein
MPKKRPSIRPISWERAAAIFGNPRPPQHVWERQFDHCDDELKRLAKTPYAQIDFSDLWYYYLDLAYVELEQDLFNYLFPVCLMDWHFTLLQNRSCWHGDSEFHYGVLRGNVLEKMMNQERRQEVHKFLRDSFLERLDAERGLDWSDSGFSVYGWMNRFNCISMVAPVTELIWETWWSLETPGRAVAALEYCLELMYSANQHPGFSNNAENCDERDRWIFSNDSMIHDGSWKEENIQFLSQTLAADYVMGKIAECVNRLKGEPEYEEARRIEADLPAAEALLAVRIDQLPHLLDGEGFESGWII